jgi:hypothetical protein
MGRLDPPHLKDLWRLCLINAAGSGGRRNTGLKFICRSLATGRIPPRGNNKHRIELCGLSKARPISCSDCPDFQRLQILLFSATENPNRFPDSIQHHP